MNERTINKPIQQESLQTDQIFNDNKGLNFALNCVKDSHDGSKFNYQSEPGNTEYYNMDGYSIVGNIHYSDDVNYLFLTNGNLSRIVKIENDLPEVLVEASLGFDTNYPITGEVRVKNGCDIILYWCDYLNPDRYFNTNQPNDFKDGLGNWDVNLFSFLPDIQVPYLDLQSVNNTGGNLQSGSYYFQIELLDKKQNSIYTTDISPQTIIYDDDLNKDWNQIEGSLNYPQFDAIVGGKQPTNKSITLRLSNLIPGQFFRINVAYQVSENRVILSHTTPEKQVTGSVMTYTYKGYSPETGDSPIYYTSMLVPTARYKSSYVMEQINNRLVRANLKGDNRDYSNYQEYASQVVARWFTEECDAYKNTLGNPKNPLTYWYKTGFQSDEVYAFMIQYLHTDGTWSPLFNLIGRSANSYDAELLTVVASSPSSTQVLLSDVEHLGLVVGNTVPRWKVYNTATIISSQTTTRPYSYLGEFGYHESEATYPDLRTCNNTSIWGTGITPTTKIRHFKFPDRKLIPHIDGSKGEYLRPLGVEFVISGYPNTDIVGHRFVMADRENNQTVLDNGWASPSIQSGDTIYTGNTNTMTGTVGADPTLCNYYSTQLNSLDTVQTGDYLKHHLSYFIQSNQITNNTANFYKYYNANQRVVYSVIFNQDSVTKQFFTRENYKIDQQLFAPEKTTSYGVFTNPVENRSPLHEAGVFKLHSAGLPGVPLAAGYLNNTPNIDNDNITLRQDVETHYVSIKQNKDVYSNLFALSGKYLHLNPTNLGTYRTYGGDTLFVQNTMTFTVYSPAQEELYFSQFVPDPSDPLTHIIFSFLHVHKFWEEQKHNNSLRIEGTDLPFTFWQLGDSDDDLMKKFVNKDNGEYFGFNNIIPEYYKINRDYDVQKNQVAKIRLPEKYNYCSTCLNEYKNRIIFSPVSFDEEIQDLYLTNKINDYIDLPANKGAITGLVYLNGYLLVHCENSTFVIKPNPQVLQTDQASVYLTTGDFLSLTPNEINTTDLGFAGCQNKQHYLTVESHFWVDQKRGCVYEYDNNLSLINGGMDQWLKQNLPSNLEKDYPYQNTTHSFGSGIVLGYDPRFKRLLITKKDVKPIGRVNTPTTGLYFTGTMWRVYFNGTPVLSPTFSNTTYFENKSFTLSYDLLTKKWLSFHSYLPKYYLYNSLVYFTVNDTSVWKHLHKENYQTFYTTKYDMIIDFTDFDLNTKRLSTLYYQGYTYQWDNLSNQWLEVNETFNKFVCYSHNQSTGTQTLILQDQHTNPYQNNSLPNNQKYVIKTDQNFKISGLYDMSTNQPTRTKEWDVIKTYNGYIDEMDVNINFNKPYYEQSELYDKYVNVRLFFKPTSDCKKVILLNQVNQFISIR